MYKQSTYHASVPLNSTTALNILTIQPQEPQASGSSVIQVNPEDGVTYRTKHFNFTPSPISRNPPPVAPSPSGYKRSPPPLSPLVTGVLTSSAAKQTPTPPAKPQKKFTFNHSGNSSPRSPISSVPQSPISPVPQSQNPPQQMPNGVTVVSTDYTKSILTNGKGSQKDYEVQKNPTSYVPESTFQEVPKPTFEEYSQVQKHGNDVQNNTVDVNAFNLEEEDTKRKSVSFALPRGASDDSESDLVVSPTSSQVSVSFTPPPPPALPQGSLPPPPPPLPKMDLYPQKVDPFPRKVTSTPSEKKPASPDMMSELRNKLSSVKKDFEARPQPVAPVEMGKPKLYIDKTPRSPPPKQRHFSQESSNQSSPLSSPSVSSSSMSRKFTPSKKTDSIEKDDNDSLIGSSEMEDSKSEHSYSTGSGPGQDQDSACESDEELRAVPKSKKCQRVVLQNDGDRVLLLQVSCEKEDTAKDDKFIDLLVNIAGTCMSFFKKKNSSTMHYNGVQVQQLPIGDRPVREHIAEVARIFDEKIEVVGVGCAKSKSADKIFVGQKLKDRVTAKGPCQIGKAGSLVTLRKTNRLAPVEEFSQQLCEHIIEAKPIKLGKIQTIKVLNKKGKTLPKDQLLAQMFESDHAVTVYEAAKKCFVEVTDFTVFT